MVEWKQYLKSFASFFELSIAPIKYLSQRKSQIKCNGKQGLLIIMRDLGFHISNGRGEHKVFTHPELSNRTRDSEQFFISHSIDCGHQPNRLMKLAYVVKTICFLRQYQPILETILNEQENLS